MYARDQRGYLIVRKAWMIPALPMAIVMEMPDGAMKFWGVRQNGNPPQDNEIKDYKGHHPDAYKDGDKVSDARLVVFGMTKQKQPGTAPDTSLYLGEERKEWLKSQGGAQPVIQKLIDDAMGRE